MTIDPSVLLTFLAQVTPAEPGVLSGYRVGLGTGETTSLPADCDTIGICDVVISSSFDSAEITLDRLALVSSYSGGALVNTFPPVRNSEGDVIYLEKIYALAAHLVSYDGGTGFAQEFVYMKVEDVEAPSLFETDPITTVAINDLVGYLQGEGGLWCQTWPEGLYVRGTGKLTFTPVGSDSGGTVRVAVMGKSIPVTTWADAEVYALRDLVRNPAYDIYKVFQCISAHTAVTADNKPGTGTTWATKWEEVVY
jgi:hypothetical protein